MCMFECVCVCVCVCVCERERERESECVMTPPYPHQWQLVCSEEALASLPQLLTMLGMMCGAALLPQLGDRYGRWTLIFGSRLVFF